MGKGGLPGVDIWYIIPPKVGARVGVDKFVKFSYFSLCLQEHVFNPLMESSFFLVLSEIATD